MTQSTTVAVYQNEPLSKEMTLWVIFIAGTRELSRKNSIQEKQALNLKLV